MQIVYLCTTFALSNQEKQSQYPNNMQLPFTDALIGEVATVDRRTVSGYRLKRRKTSPEAAKLIDDALCRLIIQAIRTRHELRRYYSQQNTNAL